MNADILKELPGWKLLELAGILKQTILACEIPDWKDLKRKCEVKLDVVDREIARRLTSADKKE
jgi:hypothetical protein